MHEGLPEYSPQAHALLRGLYEHTRTHTIYEVLGVAFHEETLAELVIYRCVQGDPVMWARPLQEFLAIVDIDGVAIPRFRKFDSSNQ